MNTKVVAKDWFCFKPQAKCLEYANLHLSVKHVGRNYWSAAPARDQIWASLKQVWPPLSIGHWNLLRKSASVIHLKCDHGAPNDNQGKPYARVSLQHCQFEMNVPTEIYVALHALGIANTFSVLYASNCVNGRMPDTTNAYRKRQDWTSLFPLLRNPCG